VVASRQVRPVVQTPVVPEPVEMLLAAQQGWPMPPQAWHSPVLDCVEQ
jgi:hypothetical protein